MSKKRIVFLVDHQVRDLMGAALICHHLEGKGVTTFLEPLQSWRSCLGAWKPDMIVFNHLLHDHLIEFSKELNSYGVLVGCLLNEGLCQSDSGRRYLSVKPRADLHCDLFLTWNEKHRQALVQEAFCCPPQNATTVGVPRFDFYREPYSKIFKKPGVDTGFPRILINTTFSIAHYKNRTEKEKLLVKGGLGGEETENGKNYQRLIDSHFRSREMLPLFLGTILNKMDCKVTIRPHPREEIDFYANWIESLDPSIRGKVEISQNPSVTSDILNHDLIINCEDCTTALEAWIAGKPTITLALSQDPAFFTETWRKSSPIIDVPDSLVAGIERALRNPDQPDFKSVRDDIISELIYKADGQSSLRAAEAIHGLLTNKKEAPRIPFKFNIIRRAIKLRFLNLIDQPVHATPTQILFNFLKIKTHENSSMRDRCYYKAPRPSDVSRARKSISSILS